MLRDFRKVFKSSKGLTGSLMIVLSFGLLAYLGTAFQTTHPDSPELVLARVYGRDIKRRDVNEVMERMIQQFGGQQENMDAIMPFVQQQAVGQLLNLKLTEELADRHGVVVTDSELREALTAELRSFPFLFFFNGQLLPTAEIKNVLAQYFRVALKTFEDSTRSRVVMAKLYEQAAALVPVDEAWLNEENRARNENMTLEFIALAPLDWSVADPGDEKLEEFLKGSGDRFQVGPRRVLQVATVEQNSFGGSLMPTEEDLKRTYEAKKASYLELKASHILIRGATPDEIKAAEEKILKIRARLVAGANFAKVAEAESEDPSAQANRGDLGWFKNGVMDKGFWDGAVSLQKGEISQPVQSMYGLHLIKLEDRKDRTFEEVKTELTSEIIAERFSAKAKEKLEQLLKRVGEKGDLATAASSLGIKVSATEPFVGDAATIQGLEGVPYAASDAFSMKVGQVSQVVSAPGRFMVYRVQRELPIAVPPLKEIRDKVFDAFRQEEARRALLAMAAEAAGDIKALGATETLKEQPFAKITEVAENMAARKTLLETPVGGITKAVWTNDGKLWVAKILERTPAPPLSQEGRMELLKSIQSQESMKLISAELEDLRVKGGMRQGFNSLWGRINGIYINEPALSRKAPSLDY
jgi:peptidyl-prolyl cis-trans isomerase D